MPGEKVICTNRKARHDYAILESYEAGIALVGTEVKSLRAGRANLRDAYCRVEGGEMFLVGADIPIYEQGNVWNHEPRRRRKLLMHKREIVKLGSKVAERGLTMVPLRMYFKGGRAKVEVALAKGKREHDRRQIIRDRDMERDTRRELSRY